MKTAQRTLTTSSIVVINTSAASYSRCLGLES